MNNYHFYLFGIFIAGLFYYPLKEIINNDVLFVSGCIIYLLFLRFAPIWFKRSFIQKNCSSMNYIKENLQGAKFHTSLRDIERWLEIDLKDYDWHISDVEGAWPELNDPSWITGEKLSTKIREYDYQFVWAVLSAFPKNSEPRTTSKPYAEGNSALWENSPRKQMRDSLFEIVCWDSSATLFIGLPDNLSNNLLVNAPGIKELNNENKERRESL